ncbi:hypothetical protein PLICRDRAFT_147929 [Plicaturopsis crispa FD-325 SS-3]|uniref:Uncharacterized protein n=1 Tax=Plicaturopsis crispa FD-325 SS-3 TaxID=944288 RepID=A0A0C9SKJ5_PLICR|nr:hypothetical protein PLICRDRAFT_147929 [Plicaturopsis crispa FD-325 SS-3]
MAFSFTDKLWVKIKSVYLRITFSKFTAAFFIFGFLHCFAQGLIQSFMFSIDMNASSLATSIVTEAQVSRREMAWLTRSGEDFNLKLCTDIPYGQAIDSCVTVFQSGQPNITVPAGYRRQDEAESAQDLNPASDWSAYGSVNGVTVQLDGEASPRFLNTQCTRVLVYPQQVLQNLKREDIALICVQFWLFYMSFVAVVYDSVPHTLAILCARVLTTGWSAYSIWRLKDIDVRFRTLVSDASSPCHADLFSTFVPSRGPLEIADLLLNCTALVISAYLSINLLKVYTEHTFKRVGPPPNIMRIYRYFLAIFVCLQLSGFLLVTAMGLWIDQLFNTAVAFISTHTTIYIASFLFTAILLIPWVILGWFAVRRERRKLMTTFLVIGFIFIAGWSVMFYSQVYRWQFVQFPFFACITLEAFIVMIASCVLGAVCWRNFDKGLAHYLYVEEVLSSTDFEHAVFPRDMEKGEPFDAPPVYEIDLRMGPAYTDVIDIKSPPAAYTRSDFV